MGWRNGDWYWSDLGVEDLFYIAQDFECRLLRSRDASGTAIAARSTRHDPVRDTLPTLFGTVPIARDDHRTQFCRSGQPKHLCFIRSRGRGCAHGSNCRLQGRDRRLARRAAMA